LLGEQIQDDSCWVIKTHFPQLYFPFPFDAGKIVCVTRHPIDVLPSFATLMWTQSHSLETKRPVNEYKVWDEFVKTQIPIFGEYHRRMIEQAKTTPTFFLTYEQMINEPQKIITALFCFLLGVKTLKDTIVEAQISKINAIKHTDPKM